MKDQIGSSHMAQGNLTSFTTDRFGCVDSALALNGGWTKVPSGIYFDAPEFTISVWVYPQKVGSWARIIDFGNGPALQNVYFAFSRDTILKPYFEIFFELNSVVSSAAITQQITQLESWQFFVATFDSKTARVYLNGQLFNEVNNSYSLPSNFSRSKCFIGKSNWPTDGYSYSYLDELRFYNKSLTQQEIIQLMNQNSTSRFSIFGLLFQMKLFNVFFFNLRPVSHFNYNRFSVDHE
jgi:hypothetical protein